MQNKKLPEITPHAGRATSPQNQAAKKSCHGQTPTNECSIFDHPSSFKGPQPAPHAISPRHTPPRSHIPSPNQKAKAESNRNRYHTPHPPWNPKGHTPDHIPNAPHIRHNVPHKPIHILTSHPKHPQSHQRKQLKHIQLPGRPQYRLIKCLCVCVWQICFRLATGDINII